LIELNKEGDIFDGIFLLLLKYDYLSALNYLYVVDKGLAMNYLLGSLLVFWELQRDSFFVLDGQFVGLQYFKGYGCFFFVYVGVYFGVYFGREEELYFVEWLFLKGWFMASFKGVRLSFMK